MNACPRCGTSCGQTDKFCGFCGFNLAAGKTCELATQVSLKGSDIRLDLGKTYYDLGKYEQALKTFAEYLNENPGNPEAREMYRLAQEALDS